MCPRHFVKITDGDGTTLMDRGCGYSERSPTSYGYFLPPIITTLTNTVDIFFHTDGSGAQKGWSLNWTAVTPGLKSLLVTAIQRFPKSLLLHSGKQGKQKRPWSHLKGRCAMRSSAVQFTHCSEQIYLNFLTPCSHILKHRKNCECCPVVSFTIDRIVISVSNVSYH